MLVWLHRPLARIQSTAATQLLHPMDRVASTSQLLQVSRPSWFVFNTTSRRCRPCSCLRLFGWCYHWNYGFAPTSTKLTIKGNLKWSQRCVATAAYVCCKVMYLLRCNLSYLHSYKRSSGCHVQRSNLANLSALMSLTTAC